MSERSSVLVGMGQILVVGGEVRENMRRAVEMIGRAAAAGCEAVVLPECLDVGWAHPSAAERAEPIPGPRTDELAEAAARHGILVVAGLTERAGDRLYNAAALLAADGRLLLKHRKINLLCEVEGLYAVGDRLGVARTPLGTLGVNICADNFPDSLDLGHALARMGAQMILSPCAWAVPSGYDHAREPYGALWKDAYGDLARWFEMPVIGVSNVGVVGGGPWEGWKCIGCSLAVGPEGEVLAQAPYGESAECLLKVRAPILPRRAAGTAIAQMLRRKAGNGDWLPETVG